MIKIIFIIIILFIIFQNLLENKVVESELSSDSRSKLSFDNLDIQPKHTLLNNLSPFQSFDLENRTLGEVENYPQIITYDTPNPWSKIIIYDNKEYNYHFYIKIHIPSLNAYENWKQIIPNLNFNATTRELIIPSKDEQSALALINLIYMNFMGQISLTNILEKNLIKISINKCKAYKVIENKIRDQINDNLNGNVNAKINVLYEKDLSSIQNSDQKNSKKINFLNMDTNNELNNRRLDNQELNNSSKFFNSYSDSTVEAVEASRDSLNIFKSLETDPQPYDGSYFSYI